MSKYIGTPVVNVSVDTVDVTGDITTTDTTPEVIIVNSTHEDTDGGREGKVTFKGQQSGGEETTLAQIQASHDGTSDDQKGDLIFKTNDGSDGASPTERMRIDSAGLLTVTGSAHFGKTAIATSADTPVIIKSDTDHLALHLEENSGAESWQIGVDADGDLGFHNSGAAGASVTFDDSGNVLIGADSGSAFNSDSMLRLQRAGDRVFMQFKTDADQNSAILFGDVDDAVECAIEYEPANKALTFSTNNNDEAMRIDNSGKVIVGSTAATFNADAKIVLSPNSDSIITNNGQCLSLNRTSTDGDILVFYKDQSTVGQIGANGGYIYAGSGNVNLRYHNGADAILPATSGGASRDNVIDMGSSGARFDDIFATNSTIQTSDRNEKQDIEELTDAEQRVAVAAKGLIKKFRWKDAVEKKGDDARIHVGIIAQDLQAAFEAEGLDAGRYGMFISDTWWEADRVVPAVEANEEEGIEAVAEHTVTDTFDTQEEAPEGATKRTRLGVRYSELLAFIIGAI